MEMLRLDLAGCTRDRIGDAGLCKDDLAANRDSLLALIQQLNDSDCTDMDRWRRLADDPLRSDHLGAVNSVLDALPGEIENLVALPP